MLCAVFLDRRYSTELGSEERALAIRTLVKLWEQIRSEHGNNSNIENCDSDSFTFADTASVLEAYFNSKGVDLMASTSSNNKEPNLCISNASMINMLHMFDEKEGRQQTTKNVLEYWEEEKGVYPEIYLLSTIINAVPPTQATTERCFSTLNFIYDDKRTRLSLILLEQILLMRLNKDLVLSIFAEDLELIKKENVRQ